MNDTFRRNRESHEEALKAIKADQKDLRYGLQDNTKAIAELCKLVAAQTIIKLKKKK